MKAGSKVQNIEGTADCEPKRYDSWKDFYIGESSCEWPPYCRISRCMENAEHGAHVTCEEQDGVWIIPMCPTHNNPHNTKCMTVNAGTTAVEVLKKDVTGPHKHLF